MHNYGYDKGNNKAMILTLLTALTSAPALINASTTAA